MFDGYANQDKFAWDQDTMFDILSKSYNVDIRTMLRDIKSRKGVSLSSIAKLLIEHTVDHAKPLCTVKIWTLESPLGYAVCGSSLHRGAKVNIAVQAGHAFGMLKKSTLIHLTKIGHKTVSYEGCYHDQEPCYEIYRR